MVTSVNNNDVMRAGVGYGPDGMHQFSNMHKSTQNIPEVRKKQQMNETGWRTPVFQQAEVYTNHTRSVTKKKRGWKQNTNHKKIIHPPTMGRNN